MRHADGVAAPVVTVVEPAAHATHALAEEAASDVEYVPRPQSVQVCALAAAAYEPAGHMAHAVEPAVEKYPGKHAVHDEALVAPTTDDAVPAGHGEHDDAPSPAPNVPAGHDVHWVALVMPAVVEKVPAGQKPSQTVVPGAI